MPSPKARRSPPSNLDRQGRGRRRMSWKAQIDELQRRREWAEAQGGTENVKRQHDQGRLTVRERIAHHVDADAFQEVGKLTGKGEYGGGTVKMVVTAPYVMGLAQNEGRPGA